MIDRFFFMDEIYEYRVYMKNDLIIENHNFHFSFDIQNFFTSEKIYFKLFRILSIRIMMRRKI